MRLLLIRHGQTPNNATRSLDTAFPGAGLTRLGEQQAEAVPVALKDQQITAVYASPLIRTQLTARPLASSLGLDIRIVPGLEEVGAGALEMLNDAESVAAYAECVIGWMEGDLDRRMPGGATGREFLDRYDRAVQQIAGNHGPDDRVAVFSHGAAIRTYTAVSTGMDPTAVRNLTIQNTGMSVLAEDAWSRWTLECWHAEPLGGSGLSSVLQNDGTGVAP